MLIEGISDLGSGPPPLCVVGSGPVGLSFAVECARRGVRTLLLESGGASALPSVQQLSAADLVDPRRHDDMEIAVSRRLGGTSHLWGGRCLPFDPVDFHPRKGIDASWPISYDDLAAYIPRAVVATGSGAPVYHADKPLFPHADDLFNPDALERWVNVQASSDLFRADIEANPLLEVRTLATVTGLDFAENGALSGLQVAHSLTGERSHVPVSRVVLAGGGIETTRLLLAATRDAPNRFGGRDGPLGRYYMGHLYGEIADIVFAQGTTAKAMDYHVDGHGSYVRRRIVASQATQVRHDLLNCAFWPLVPPIADARHNSAILSLVYLALRNRRFGNMLVAEAIRRRHIPGRPGPILPHIRNVATGLPSALSFAAGFLKKRYASPHRMPGFFVQNAGNRYGLSYHAEHAPNRNSQVRLTGEVDRLGTPRLSVDLRFADIDADSVVRTHDLLEDWLVRNGIGAIEYRVPRADRHDAIMASATHGTHQIGLARMGASRRDGVVNAELQTFDCPNLHVAGCAVLPTSGQANPTLTAIALGLRLADRMIDDVQRKMPQIDTELDEKKMSPTAIN